MSFWVVGGIYKDTKFKELAEGQKLEARQKWDYHSWQNVDNCFYRFTIIQK